MAKVLIIDDEREIAESTAEYFTMFDIPTDFATDYEEGMRMLEQNAYGLLLLDINLKEHSGFELCKALRQRSSIPILFISARNSDDDILTALNIGGDDYIQKPFTLNILLAKVKAVFKRCERAAADEKRAPVANERLSLDHNYHQAILDGRSVKLKEMEYQLLKYLMENEGRVIPKDELFEKVWPDAFVGDGTLAVHIRQLRKKLEKCPETPEMIQTVWGIGYVFKKE